MKKIIVKIGVIVSCTLGGMIISGCTKFLEEVPNDKKQTSEAITTLEQAKVALTGCYDGLQDYRYYGRNFIIISEIYADNAKLGSTNNGLFSSMYNHNVTAYDQEIAGLWTVCYQIINRANQVITRVPQLTTGSKSDKDQIVGEALALRALVYLDLIRTFAQPYDIKSGVDSANGDGGHLGVPLILTPSTEDSIISPKRNTVKQVYTQIFADLDSAEKKVTISPADKYSISPAAIKSLKIRALYSKNENNNVIRRFFEYYRFIDAGFCGFAENSDTYMKQWSDISETKDVVFAIPASPIDNNGTNSLFTILTQTQYVAASSDLYNSYTTSDIRKKFYSKVSNIAVSKYNSNTQYIPLIRNSEVVLNYCESQCQYGIANSGYASTANLNLILGQLNSIRKQNGGSSIQSVNSWTDLLEIIQQERRKELAFEGHRLFDLKRRHAAISRSDCQATSCTLDFPSPQFAFPIPASEVNANSNMIQNPGY